MLDALWLKLLSSGTGKTNGEWACLPRQSVVVVSPFLCFQIPEAEDEVDMHTIFWRQPEVNQSDPDPVNYTCHLFGLTRTAE